MSVSHTAYLPLLSFLFSIVKVSLSAVLHALGVEILFSMYDDF